jgi:predicted nucleotidyltransferase
MDVAHPIRAVVPSLDGPVLEVLAGTTRPLTTLEIHRLAAVGSSTGIRKVLERLAAQGIAVADHRGNAIYYVANRDHLAWPAVEILTGLRRELRRRLADFISGWSVQPVHASLFGSAARADGDAASDIDILVVEPDVAPGEEEGWEQQIDGLRARVRAITGNRCQVFVVTTERLDEYVATRDPLVEAWLRDGVHLAGRELASLITPRHGRARR